MYRVRQLAIAVAIVHLIAVLGLSSGPSNSFVSGLYGVAPAFAQEAKPKKRRSLFSILFGKKQSSKKKVTSKNRAQRSKKSRSASAARKNSWPVFSPSGSPARFPQA